MFANVEDIEELVKNAINLLKSQGFLQEGDTILVAGGDKIVKELEPTESKFNKVIGGIVNI